MCGTVVANSDQHMSQLDMQMHIHALALQAHIDFCDLIDMIKMSERTICPRVVSMIEVDEVEQALQYLSTDRIICIARNTPTACITRELYTECIAQIKTIANSLAPPMPKQTLSH